MNNHPLCNGARVALGERYCRLFLRAVSAIPGGLWSWKVYVDGNIEVRGPGSTRKDERPWYGLLFDGLHRVVIREFDAAKPDRIESNTLHFTISGQAEIVVNVHYDNGEIKLSMSV